MTTPLKFGLNSVLRKCQVRNVLAQPDALMKFPAVVPGSGELAPNWLPPLAHRHVSGRQSRGYQSAEVSQQLEDVTELFYGVHWYGFGVEVHDVVADHSQFIKALDEHCPVQRPS